MSVVKSMPNIFFLFMYLARDYSLAKIAWSKSVVIGALKYVHLARDFSLAI